MIKNERISDQAEIQLLKDELSLVNNEKSQIAFANNKLIKSGNPNAKTEYLDKQRKEMN